MRGLEAAIRHRLQDVAEELEANGILLNDLKVDLENLRFQLSAHRHDQKKYQEREHQLRVQSAVVSLREYRMLLGDLEFMVDVIGGLEKREASLEQKRATFAQAIDALIEERRKLEHDLAVIQNQANVLPFRRNDDRRDESQDPV